MQTHGFEQHLIAVGCTVKSASALAMVSRRLCFQQFCAVYQTLSGQFTHLGFFIVRQAAAHGPSRNKHSGQMAKMQSTNQEARHNFVAHPQHECRVKNIVTQRHCGRHGNHIAAEQAELHARRALRHTIAHGRHTPRHLRGCAPLSGLVFDQVRVMLQGGMRRQQIVVGIDHAYVGATRCSTHHRNAGQTRCPRFVGSWHRGKSMRHIGTAKPICARFSISRRIDLFEVSDPCRLASQRYAGGHFGYRCIQGHRQSDFR